MMILVEITLSKQETVQVLISFIYDISNYHLCSYYAYYSHFSADIMVIIDFVKDSKRKLGLMSIYENYEPKQTAVEILKHYEKI